MHGLAFSRSQTAGPLLQSLLLLLLAQAEPKKRAWRHGRAWKMKIRAWKNQDLCFNFTSLFMLFYINILFKLIVSDALRTAIKHECIFRTLIQQK